MATVERPVFSNHDSPESRGSSGGAPTTGTMSGSSGRSGLRASVPATFGQLHRRVRWLLPVLAIVVVVLAFLARLDALPWDLSLAEWIARHRTARWDDFWGSVTKLGGYNRVAVVVVVCAVVAWFKSRALAIAIVVLALLSPLLVEVLKQIVARPRPPIELALHHHQPSGFSFPSGHPLAVAASWGFVPLVVGLYTNSRRIFWLTVAAVWSLVVVIAASRVYVGAHHATDVTASLLLALLFVAGSEVVIDWIHERHDRRIERRRMTGSGREEYD